MKIPILRTILHLFVLGLIIFILATSQGCSRHSELIILKHPSSVEYAEAMQNWGER